MGGSAMHTHKIGQLTSPSILSLSHSHPVPGRCLTASPWFSGWLVGWLVGFELRRLRKGSVTLPWYKGRCGARRQRVLDLACRAVSGAEPGRFKRCSLQREGAREMNVRAGCDARGATLPLHSPFPHRAGHSHGSVWGTREKVSTS